MYRAGEVMSFTTTTMSSEHSNEFQLPPSNKFRLHTAYDGCHSVVYDIDISILSSEAWGLTQTSKCIFCGAGIVIIDNHLPTVVTYDCLEQHIYRNKVLACAFCKVKYFITRADFPPNTPEDKKIGYAEYYDVPLSLGEEYNLIRNKYWRRLPFLSSLPGSVRYLDLENNHNYLLPRRFIHYCAETLSSYYILAYKDQETEGNDATRNVKFLRKEAVVGSLTDDPEAMALVCMGFTVNNIPEILQVFDPEIIDMYKLKKLMRRVCGATTSMEFGNPDLVLLSKRTAIDPLSQEEADLLPRPKRRRREADSENSSNDD